MGIDRKLKNAIHTGLATVLLIITAVSSVAMTVIPSYAAEKSDESNEKVVRIGYYSEAGMMNGAHEGETKSGYAYEYMQEIASEAGWKYEYIYGSFSSLYSLLLAGEIDMLPYITKTEARTQLMLFPDMKMGDEQFYIASMKPGRLSDDLSELKGKKIGTTKDAFQNIPFRELIEEKNIDCQLVEYKGPDERWTALASGVTDYSIETDTAFQRVSLHAVYEFGERYPYYMVVSPGREDLLEELNSAHRKLEESNPGYLANLKYKYFKGIPLYKEIPDESLAWLESHDRIRIGTYDKNTPYVIADEEGNISGVAPDYTRIMLEEMGIDLPVEWLFYKDKSSALEALKNGEVDLLNPYYRNYNDAEKDGVIISREVYSSGMSILYRGQYTEDTLSTIATSTERLGTGYVRDNYPKSRIIECNNGYDCVDKLLAGNATSVILYSDALYEIDEKYKENFKIKALNAHCPVCFASTSDNAALISIINKAAPFVTELDMNEIQNKYSSENKLDVSLFDFFVEHPECLWGIIAVIFAIAFMALLYKNRKDKDIENKQKEAELYKSVTERFTSDFDAVILGNVSEEKFRIVSGGTELGWLIDTDNSLTQLFDRFVESAVYYLDKERIRNDIIDVRDTREKLAIGESHSIEYRGIFEDGYLWYRATLTRISEDDILLGFRERDKEIMSDIITEKLMNDYDAVYIVDLDREEIRSVIASRISEVGNFEDRRSYSSTILAFAETVAPRYKQDWIDFGDVEYVKRYMQEDDHREYVFELPGADKEMRRLAIDVIERDGDEALTLLYSFMGIDDYRAQTISLHRQIADQRVLLEYFVDSYDSAYYLDLEKDHIEILHMKHEFREFFGKNGDGEDGMMAFIDEHIHPEDRALMFRMTDKEYIKNRLSDEGSFSFIVREIFGDVEKAMRGIIIRGSDVEHIAVGFMNITEELREERESKERLEEALTFTNYFLGTYVSAYYVNLITCGWQVYKRTESLEKDYPKVDSYFDSLSEYIANDVHPDDREALIEVSKPERMKKILEERNEYTHAFRDISGGVEKVYRMQVIRGADEEHAAFGFVDITEAVFEQREQERKLQEALNMAQSASRAKTTFLNSMSHDIRTPMNAIIGYTHLAENHLDDTQKIQDYLGKIGQSSNHLLSLINDVLDMSRIESGKMSLDEKPENIKELVEILADMVQADMNAKDHTFIVNTDDVLDENIICDRLRLNQVLLNILSNAVKYTPQGGRIEMRVSERDIGASGYATYEFSIVDNGIGMDKEYLNTIFDPFTREKTSTVSGIQGTGLGMTITKSIVDMMGGKIDIDSEPGRGTEMVVSIDFRLFKGELPGASSDNHSGNHLGNHSDNYAGNHSGNYAGNHSGNYSGNHSGKNGDGNETESLDYEFSGKRILLAEDNELNREIATKVLEEYGFTVDAVADGSIAVERIKAAGTGDYELILMDIQMPTMDGYEATRKIREIGTEISKIPIIAMSANAFEEDMRAATEAGMNDYITKPINVKVMQTTLARYV